MVDEDPELSGEEEGEPLTAEEIEKYARQFQELQDDFAAMAAEVEAICDERLRRLAGPELPRMIASPEATLEFCYAPDPRRRRAAVHLASSRWRSRGLFGAPVERMARADPDGEVRDSAVYALGALYSGSKDARVGGLLGGLVWAEAESPSLRRTAYLALLRLHAGRVGIGTFLTARFPEDVDWALVGSY